jgi:hypothetical protein
MFDWLSKPYCPVDPSAKDWIERHLKWLSQQFPSNIFTDRPLVTPTEEFFPEPARNSAPRILLDSVQSQEATPDPT